MRVLRRCFWMWCVLGLVLPVGIRGQYAGTNVKTNRVFVYPKKGESVSQLKGRGIQQIEDYGSYWVVTATDEQARDIANTFGDRAAKADNLNQIELEAVRLDTAAGERAVPSGFRQEDTTGKRLRLIQFKGPVKPEWLEQVQAAGDVKIINYVPNNAYLVWLDANAEQKLRSLTDAQGPLQWVGPYHSHYKIQKGLLNVVPANQDGTVTVRVGMVDDAEEVPAESALQAFGAVQSSSTLGALRFLQLDVSPSAIPQIAQLPAVVWIEKETPKRVFDEVQDLLLTGQTNQMPGHAPVSRISRESANYPDYLEFLTNTVGGGVPSFTDPAAYPIVDIADTGVDASLADSFNRGYPKNPVFYKFGINDGVNTRIAYLQPPNYIVGAEALALGCTRMNNHWLGLEAGDLLWHGTFVASIVAGYDDSTENTFLSCNSNTVQRIDNSHFRLGLGISPFGQIGVSRVFAQQAAAATVGGVCQITITVSFCLNSIPSLVAVAYGNGGRIQNDSWGDALDLQGLNGGSYNAECVAYDTAVRDALLIGSSTNIAGPSAFNQEFIAVFANGNVGAVADPGGFADIRVTPPATAKNVISVGASESVRLDGSGVFCAPPSFQDDSYDISGFTSLGPAIDGRFKPEIVAPGSGIYGAVNQLSLHVVGACSSANLFPFYPFEVDGNCAGTPFFLYTCFDGAYLTSYSVGNGTSFAAPAVSGGIQLLWWYFVHRLTNELGQALFQPSPAMAKAYLCNSARYLPLTNPQTGSRDTLPSVAQGMGEMDLRRMFDGVPRLLRDESDPQRALDAALFTGNPAPQQTYFSRSGQSYEVSGEVSSNGLPFRVTLAWVDPPGAPFAFQELVNNLDLDVTIGGQTYKGNVFLEDHSISGGGYDSVNNLESVFLPDGGAVTSGAPYTVVVRATSIAGNAVPNSNTPLNQDFALVVYNSENPTDVPNMSTNNSCATALVITNTPFAFTNTLSRTEYSNVHPSPTAGRGGADEFFKVNLPTPGGVFTIDTTGSSFDNVLSVWRVQMVPQTVATRSECGALIEIVSHSGGISPSHVTFTADGSNDYFIVVEPHNDGPGGTMVLNVSATAPALGVSPGSLLFPDTLVGLTSAPQAVTYQNSTTVNVRISSVGIAGSNAADFVILSQSCAGNTLGPGQNCNVAIGFAPTTNGFRGAQLVISDDATGSPRIVPLGGNGLPSAPVVCLSSNSLSFGAVTLGSTSTAQSVTITNCGAAALSITSKTIFGLAAADYIIGSDTCGGPVLPGGACTFAVSFAPSATGLRPATLAIIDNATNSPSVVALIGSGQVATPQVCLSRNSLAFGGQAAGTTSSVQSVTITNCGMASLTISNLSLTGPNAGDFTLINGTCGGPISISNTCVFGVTFAPTSAAVAVASVIISNNSTANPAVVSLSGLGSGSQPNLWISKNRNLKKFIGKTVVTPPSPVSEQTLPLKGKRGKKLVFYVVFQNSGNLVDSLLVQGDGNAAGPFTVKYFLGAIPRESVEITSVVEDGTYSTGSLAPGAFTSAPTLMRVEITVDPAPAAGTYPVVITGTSSADPAKADVVRAAITIK